ncbi:hypothetical protein HMPREF1544_05936 [Mucor circinelloides 1006PhL]|uniref:Uncharacterized protein n=1 Tax=Mucor circinelloides f. circinelloides (strain 1006PhL) TaxID=1220926 RepID=S2JBS5_MUCC1|nr:hypothetical protein HMPREF1544_05936 [Mucor circinelloides 1006PhL]
MISKIHYLSFENASKATFGLQKIKITSMTMLNPEKQTCGMRVNILKRNDPPCC